MIDFEDYLREAIAEATAIVSAWDLDPEDVVLAPIEY